jgi:hypothetical protein
MSWTLGISNGSRITGILPFVKNSSLISRSEMATLLRLTGHRWFDVHFAAGSKRFRSSLK